jgi:tripartite-type tricarboxylate transporter receptor subunit TctC
VVTRIYATKMSELLGQQMVVDNRPGAGGSVAGEIVARAPADGYTLCSAANGTIAIAPNFLKLSYSATNDLARSRSSATARSPSWCTQRCPWLP